MPGGAKEFPAPCGTVPCGFADGFRAGAKEPVFNPPDFRTGELLGFIFGWAAHPRGEDRGFCSPISGPGDASRIAALHCDDGMGTMSRFGDKDRARTCGCSGERCTSCAVKALRTSRLGHSEEMDSFIAGPDLLVGLRDITPMFSFPAADD